MKEIYSNVEANSFIKYHGIAMENFLPLSKVASHCTLKKRKEKLHIRYLNCLNITPFTLYIMLDNAIIFTFSDYRYWNFLI